MQGSSSESIKSHIFSVRLRNKHRKAPFSENSNWGYIFYNISTCESLISRVEERNKLLLLQDFSNFDPLSGSRVNSSRIVRTHMQHNNVSLLRVLQEFDEVINFDFFGGRVIVGVILESKPTLPDDVFVVGPSGSRKQHVGRWYLLFDQLESQSERTCT